MNAEREFLPSASSMPRLYHCNGSFALERAVGENERPSDEALQGTEIAQALETLELEGLDEEGRNIAQRLLVMEKKAVADWLKDIGFKGEPIMVREADGDRLWIRQKGVKVASAKPDVFYIAGTHALDINHKTGYLPILRAAINIQTRTEAIAIWHEYPKIEHVRACTAHYRFREDFAACDYTHTDLQRAEGELFWHLKKANEPDAPRVPSVNCRYCKALSACPEVAAMSLLPVVHTGPEIMKKAEVIELVRRLTAPQKAFIQERKTMITNFLDANSDSLRALPPEELASVGLQLVPGGNVRVIPSVQAMWNVLFAEKSLTFTPEEFQTCLKATVTAIEEKLVEKIQARDGGTKKDALVKAKKIMEPAVQLVPKAPMLKPLKGDKALPEAGE